MIHTFEPVYNEKSEILILGTFPSVKSRASGFYYQHPQNRFWKVVSALAGVPIPGTIEEQKTLLLENHIAVWDVIYSCDINGSSDSSIRNVVPNDIRALLDMTSIKTIYANSGTWIDNAQGYPTRTFVVITPPKADSAIETVNLYQYSPDQTITQWTEAQAIRI